MGSGTGSLLRFRSETVSFTSLRIPSNAFSGDFSSQLRLGNSAHKPTYSESSPDQVTRYVNRSTSLAITTLNSSNCQKDLPDLIRLCLTARGLNIDSRVSGPGHSVNPVTGPGFSRFSKKMIADFAKVVVADSSGISPHPGQDVFDRSHRRMISLVIPLSRCGRPPH